jgi:hypothetical protein
MSNAVVWTLVPLWLAATAWLFWAFQVRDLRPFSDDPRPYAQLQGETTMPAGLASVLRELAGPGMPTVVRFLDRNCRCSRFNEPHAARIRERFADRGVRFVTVDAAAPAVETDFATLPSRLQQWLPIPASPAALVLNGQAEIAYFGPYSVGAGCFTGSGDYVERALERVLSGDRARQLNVMDSGCYCAWPNTAAEPADDRGFAAA